MNDMETMGAADKEALALLFNSIRPGDRVTIFTPQGQHQTGKAVICGQKSSGVVALNMGGKYGTPGTCTMRNLVEVKHTKLQHGGA